jgi:ryanodine receptor 2
MRVVDRGNHDRTGERSLVTTYTPETIDTSRIKLNPKLEELVEKLAQNNHDHWARKRIEEGWRYGKRRNDEDKEHPDLVPYDRLPESEKDYDRKTVVEALKAIIALGYEVRKCS